MDYTSNRAANLDEWNHVAAVKNGSSIRLYLNGSSVASRTDPFAFTPDGEIAYGELHLGEFRGDTYVGMIDEVLIFDYAVSLPEITAKANDGPPRPSMAGRQGLCDWTTYPPASICWLLRNQRRGSGGRSGWWYGKD